MDVRVEDAVGLDLGEPLARERVRELAVHEPDALLELRLLVLLGGRERPLEVVEHGQQLLHEPLVGPRDQALLVARDPLAVVLELGRDPLEVVQVLVALGLERRHLLLERELTGVACLGHEVFASSSTTSASSITSSSDSVASPLPPAEACACARLGVDRLGELLRGLLERVASWRGSRSGRRSRAPA